MVVRPFHHRYCGGRLRWSDRLERYVCAFEAQDDPAGERCVEPIPAKHADEPMEQYRERLIAADVGHYCATFDSLAK